MREPTITVGFIIFREGYEAELRKGGYLHREIAEMWVKNSPFNSMYEELTKQDDNKLYGGYETFLLEYVGAIKLYDLEGDRLCCYFPRGNNCEGKSYLRKYYANPIIRNGQEIVYELHGDLHHKGHKKGKQPIRISNYNQTLIADQNGVYHYNPYRYGD